MNCSNYVCLFVFVHMFVSISYLLFFSVATKKIYLAVKDNPNFPDKKALISFGNSIVNHCKNTMAKTPIKWRFACFFFCFVFVYWRLCFICFNVCLVYVFPVFCKSIPHCQWILRKLKKGKKIMLNIFFQHKQRNIILKNEAKLQSSIPGL